MNTKPTALAAYFARTAAIQNKLARLQQLADDHFGHDPDAINWGHVGDLGRVEAGLDGFCWPSSQQAFEGRTMATLTQLTPTQSTLIRAAAIRPDGEIKIPDTLRGGAKAKTLQELLTRGWIVAAGDSHQLTDAGYATIGHTRPVPEQVQPSDDVQNLEAIVQPCRSGTKLAKLVASLQNPEGATIFQLMCSTGWQPMASGCTASSDLRLRQGCEFNSHPFPSEPYIHGLPKGRN